LQLSFLLQALSLNGGGKAVHPISWFAAWRDGCVFERINHALVIVDRERVGREAIPSAAIIDSQSVKTTEAGGPRGYDAGKKVNGRKRHAIVDTDGRSLLLEPHPASIQGRDGGGPLLRASVPCIRSADPGEEALNHPSTRQNDEAGLAGDLAHDLDDDVAFAIRSWL
jgi:transposase